MGDEKIYAIVKSAFTEIDNDPPEAAFHAVKDAIRQFREPQLGFATVEQIIEELTARVVGKPELSSPSLADLAKIAREKRNQWHEDFGVPISHAYAEFLEAIGNLINVCEARGTTQKE